MIEKIIETLTPPEAWTKGSYARTAAGNPIGHYCANATCFCMMGATYHATPADAGDVGIDLEMQSVGFISAAIRELFPIRTPYGHIPRFNDDPDTTHEDVLRVLCRARELELAAT